jgi:heme exporter protein B
MVNLVFLQRELRLLARQKADWLNPILFFIIVLSLFPLGVGPEPNMLRIIAPGVVWIAALLSVLLAAERLFKDDYCNGVIEQLVAGRQSLLAFVLAKTLANWLSTGLPLLLLSPVVALLLGLNRL